MAGLGRWCRYRETRNSKLISEKACRAPSSPSGQTVLSREWELDQRLPDCLVIAAKAILQTPGFARTA